MTNLTLKDMDTGEFVSLIMENSAIEVESTNTQNENVLEQILTKIVVNYCLRVYDQSGRNFIKEVNLLDNSEEFLVSLIFELKRYGYSIQEAPADTIKSLELLEKEIKAKSDGLSQESFEYPI